MHNYIFTFYTNILCTMNTENKIINYLPQTGVLIKSCNTLVLICLQRCISYFVCAKKAPSLQSCISVHGVLVLLDFMNNFVHSLMYDLGG